MTCKKCGAEMRVWFLRPAFRSLVCPECEFVAIVREDAQQVAASQYRATPRHDLLGKLIDHALSDK
jgi:hypothetical protein